jgi:hypothetical protein
MKVKSIFRKIIKFQKIVGILNNIFKPNNVQKATGFGIHKTLAIPALTYGSEIWTLRKQDKHRLTASEMKLFGRTAEYTIMDRKKNEEIIEEVHMAPVLGRTKNTWKIVYSSFQEWIPIDYFRKF